MTRSWVFLEADCSGCRTNPCVCPAPVTVPCVCGGRLSAMNTLEDKGRAHVAHVAGDRHQAWRDDPRRERPTADPSPRDVSVVVVCASAAAAGGQS